MNGQFQKKKGKRMTIKLIEAEELKPKLGKQQLRDEIIQGIYDLHDNPSKAALLIDLKGIDSKKPYGYVNNLVQQLRYSREVLERIEHKYIKFSQIKGADGIVTECTITLMPKKVQSNVG